MGDWGVGGGGGAVRWAVGWSGRLEAVNVRSKETVWRGNRGGLEVVKVRSEEICGTNHACIPENESISEKSHTQPPHRSHQPTSSQEKKNSPTASPTPCCIRSAHQSQTAPAPCTTCATSQSRPSSPSHPQFCVPPSRAYDRSSYRA